MSKISSHQLNLESIKQQARLLSKQKNITKGEALEVLAKSYDFSSWNDFRNYILKFGSPVFEKVTLEEFNSSVHRYDQIRGFISNQQRTSLQIKISCVSLFDKNLKNIDDILLFLDREIKDTISKSKNDLFIYLLLSLDAKATYPFCDIDGFFNSILHRYHRLFDIKVRFYLEPPDQTKSLEWISEINAELAEILGAFK